MLPRPPSALHSRRRAPRRLKLAGRRGTDVSAVSNRIAAGLFHHSGNPQQHLAIVKHPENCRIRLAARLVARQGCRCGRVPGPRRRGKLKRIMLVLPNPIETHYAGPTNILANEVLECGQVHRNERARGVDPREPSVVVAKSLRGARVRDRIGQPARIFSAPPYKDHAAIRCEAHVALYNLSRQPVRHVILCGIKGLKGKLMRGGT